VVHTCRKLHAPRLLESGITVPAKDRLFSSVDDALSWRAEHRFDRLLIVLGFTRRDIETHASLTRNAGEPVIIGDLHATRTEASASFIDGEPVVTCGDVTRQLRKSVIRATLRRKGIAIRTPALDEHFSQYFALRYRIWEKVQYLRKENSKTRTRWEVDFWDRTAVPWCAIDPDGKVVGCVRLMRTHGKEESSYVEKIQFLLDRCGDPELGRLFQFPRALKQPFDLLEEFQEFQAYFRPLIRSKTSLAEIGRVIVDEGHRGQGLAEALVDTALSCAQAKGVARVFLACEDNLAEFYAKCGFHPIDGLRSDKFFNINRPSIVMERWTQAASSQVAA
jgi:predicted GNAT family N-acyltransferase